MKVSFRQRLSGFTLVELMVAIVVALIISAGVISIFVSSRKAYETQDKLARVQENGRFAMHYLMQDIRMAKYMGCLQEVVDVVRSNLNSTSGSFSYGATSGTNAFGVDQRIQATDPLARPIEGVDDAVATSTWSPSGTSVGLVPGAAAKYSVPASNYTTDMLSIRRAVPLARVSAAMASENAPVVVNPITPFSANQIVLIANCNAGEIFQISGIDNGTSTLQHATSGGSGFSPGNWTADFGKTYGNGDNAQIYGLATRIYYVRTNAAGVPSLYREENGGAAEELVEGIESLQITYGMSDGPTKQPARYLRAGAAGLVWQNVVSVRIGILARTSTQNFGDPNTTVYNVNGTNVGPFNDRHERRVFETTISLKNMAL